MPGVSRQKCQPTQVQLSFALLRSPSSGEVAAKFGPVVTGLAVPTLKGLKAAAAQTLGLRSPQTQHLWKPRSLLLCRGRGGDSPELTELTAEDLAGLGRGEVIFCVHPAEAVGEGMGPRLRGLRLRLAALRLAVLRVRVQGCLLDCWQGCSAAFHWARRQARRARPPAVDKVAATHFLAVRVDSPEVCRCASEVQDAVVARGGDGLSKICIKPDKFHITLLALRLRSPADVSSATDALESVAWEVRSDLKLRTSQGNPQLCLDFAGLSSFGQRVLYACADGDGITILDMFLRSFQAKLIARGLGACCKHKSARMAGNKGERSSCTPEPHKPEQCMQKAYAGKGDAREAADHEASDVDPEDSDEGSAVEDPGAISDTQHPTSSSQAERPQTQHSDLAFVPHLTLLKSRTRKISIPKSAWEHLSTQRLGRQMFGSLDLCRMKGDPATGYYVIEHSISL